MRIDFNRVENYATVAGMCFRGGEPIYSIMRALADRGWGSASAEFYDERGMHCMTVLRIAAGAKMYRPTEAEDADKAAKRDRRKLERAHG